LQDTVIRIPARCRVRIGFTKVVKVSEAIPGKVCGDSPGIDDGCSEVDHGLEAAIGFASAHADALEFLEFAEEVFDEVAPLVHFGVERDGSGASRVLRDDDFCTPLVEIGDDIVAVESLVSEQCAELDAVDEWSNAN